MYCFTWDHIVHTLYVSIIELIIVKMVLLLPIFIQLVLGDIILVSDNAFSTNGGNGIHIGMHRGHQETGIRRLSVDDILGTIKPSDASLQSFALMRSAKLHYSAHIIRLTQVLRCKINVILRERLGVFRNKRAIVFTVDLDSDAVS